MDTDVKKILIVDDEVPFVRSLVASFCNLEEMEHYVFFEAHDGIEALLVLNSEDVDLVVTDLKMPRMDGFEFLATVANTRPHLPVIVMTAFNTPDIEERVWHTGAVLYVEKPVDVGDFARKIIESVSPSASGHITGIQLPEFMQIIEMGGKSCTLEVRTETERATLYFLKGALIDGEAGELHGLDAVLEVTTWNDVTIDIKGPCWLRKDHVGMTLNNILMTSFQRQDERVHHQVETGSGAGASDEFDLAFTEAAMTAGPGPPSDSDVSTGDMPATRPDKNLTRQESDIETGSSRARNSFHHLTKEREIMSSIQVSLDKAMQINGALGVALVDFDSGMCLATAGNAPFDLELAAAGNVEVVRAKKIARDKIGIRQRIEDILITLDKQYHLIRMLSSSNSHFFYLVLDRGRSNLALARKELESLDKSLDF